MTSAVCEKFSSQASPEVLTALRHLVARICCSRIKICTSERGFNSPRPTNTAKDPDNLRALFLG